MTTDVAEAAIGGGAEQRAPMAHAPRVVPAPPRAREPEPVAAD